MFSLKRLFRKSAPAVSCVLAAEQIGQVWTTIILSYGSSSYLTVVLVTRDGEEVSSTFPIGPFERLFLEFSWLGN